MYTVVKRFIGLRGEGRLKVRDTYIQSLRIIDQDERRNSPTKLFDCVENEARSPLTFKNSTYCFR